MSQEDRACRCGYLHCACPPRPRIAAPLPVLPSAWLERGRVSGYGWFSTHLLVNAQDYMESVAGLPSEARWLLSHTEGVVMCCKCGDAPAAPRDLCVPCSDAYAAEYGNP